jgi:hypothetical protein
VGGGTHELYDLEIEVPSENRLQIHLGISPVKNRRGGRQDLQDFFDDFHFETEPSKQRATNSKRKSEHYRVSIAHVLNGFIISLKPNPDIGEDENEL